MIQKRLMAVVTRLPGLLVASLFWPGLTVAALSPEAKAPCDWLQEVKRTNTWFERDQDMRIAAYKLHVPPRVQGAAAELERTKAREAVVANDHLLQGELDDLVARCGWPTTSGYGDKAPQYASIIVQHADLAYQERYLPIMQAAAAAGELPLRMVENLEDRILQRNNLPHRYGSQLTDVDGVLTVYAMEDPQHVDERRAKMDMIPVSFCAYMSMFTPQPKTPLCDAPTPVSP